MEEQNGFGLAGGFNAEEYEPGGEPVPPGDYTIVIDESEMKATKAGTGAYLKMKLKIVDGEHEGRVIFANLNIHNPNEVAQRIGRGELSAICRACGKMQVEQPSELHNIAFRAKIGIETGQDGVDRNKLVRTLWKETTKPDLGALTGEKKSKGTPIEKDDIPF